MSIWLKYEAHLFTFISGVPNDSSFKTHFSECEVKNHCVHMNLTGLNLGHFGQQVRILSTTKLEAVGCRNGSCVHEWSLSLAVLLPACSCEFIGPPSCEFMGPPSCPHRSASSRGSRMTRMPSVYLPVRSVPFLCTAVIMNHLSSWIILMSLYFSFADYRTP